MIRFALLLAALAMPCAISAQLLPRPEAENPRLQTFEWQRGQDIILTALPDTVLTVLLEPGEQIRRITLADDRLIEAMVSSEGDGFQILPKGEISGVAVNVESDRRSYRFLVRTGSDLMAAYLVRLHRGPVRAVEKAPSVKVGDEVWRYRLRGDRSVRPAAIRDDGIRTRISFAKDQALPAIFARTALGSEELVNGYMRGEDFVIDRVYPELVFRIDKAKASARRNSRPEEKGLKTSESGDE